jgi:hypothetical protein
MRDGKPARWRLALTGRYEAAASYAPAAHARVAAQFATPSRALHGSGTRAISARSSKPGPGLIG